MKKYIIIILCLFLCSFSLVAEASSGDVRITVEEQEVEFTYTKIADYKNGEFVLNEAFKKSGVNINHIRNNEELERAIEKILVCDIESGKKIKTEKKVALINDLEDGVYLVQGVPGQDYRISPFLVSIPSWEGEEPSYQVSVFPKIQEHIEVVETGDTTQITLLLILCLVSLLIVLSLSCVFFRTVLQ